ncbi:hypothetical protein ANN_03487 [Periplaneta americana]|uniref:HTH psq-type domain-containing protein n=1 Tax=Periplaneta americana TaxID=6978 RepID=A0ABQ8U0Y4_PERAM|nr:hypothetical protein ANN_03487 [Periplaneta americana]
MGGVIMGGRRIKCIRFAGDMELLAEEEMILKDMLLQMNDSCEQYGTKINANKTNTMITGRKVMKNQSDSLVTADGDCHHLCKLMAPVRHRWSINDVIGGIRNTVMPSDCSPELDPLTLLPHVSGSIPDYLKNNILRNCGSERETNDKVMNLNKIYLHWDENDMNQAVSSVMEGHLSILAASQHYNVPFSTLHGKVKVRKEIAAGLNPVVKKIGHPSILSLEMEQALAERLLCLEERGLGQTALQVRRAAFQLAEALGIKHYWNSEEKVAGVDWFRAFLKRNSGLSLRKPEGLSRARAEGLCKEEVDHYFSILKQVLNDYQLFDKPHCIYNMDSGFPLNNRPLKTANNFCPSFTKYFWFHAAVQTINFHNHYSHQNFTKHSKFCERYAVTHIVTPRSSASSYAIT